MVLKKRLDYGFDGFHIPVVPRAPRSIRRRGPRKIAVEDRQICAFELLAAVAGKLLQENESSASSNASEAKDLLGIHTKFIKEETAEEDNKGSKSECFDHKLTAKEHNNKSISGEIPVSMNDSLIEHITNITDSDSSKKVVDCELKLGVCNSNPAEGILDTKVGGSLFPLKHSGDHINQSTDLTMANTYGAKKQVELINPDSSEQLSLYRDPLPPSASFPKHRSDDVNLGIRDDDDENSFRCNKFSTKIRAFRPQPRNSYGRFRKMLTSKYWKVAPKFRDHDLSNSDEGMKTHYHSRKRIHMRDRYIKEVPFKKRLLYNHSFVVDYDQETSNESICNTFEKGIKGEKHSSDSIIHRGNGVSTAVKAHKKQKDSKVKLSIKAFKVPELFIEVPETATIGSLKRNVMETVTAILGGGLRVGLVLQGKKVRDDNRTLQQAGIYSGNLDTLAFILEPSFTPLAETCKDSPHLFTSAEEQKSQRPPTNTILDDSSLPNVRFHPPQMTEMDIGYESNLEIATSSLVHADALTDETKQDSKALVLIPAPKAEPLSMMAMNPKAKRSEFSQRRARRPFSVTEVEALVEAVETLGTGRWRDVKMRAFDNANHRTYVDLKDKWKTLVHTASISSQQRRGEPVPQELLDRVLSAHAYWTKHQSKPHGKHNAELLKSIDARSKPVEV